MPWDAREAVRCLVDRHGYLPLAPETVLKHARFPCDLGVIADTASYILTSRDWGAELLRQGVYGLAIHGCMHAPDLYVYASVAATAIKTVVGAREEIARLRASRIPYKKSAKFLATLVWANFAAVPPALRSMLAGRPGGARAGIILPTVVTTALAVRTPIRTEDRSPLGDQHVARMLAGFGLEMRRQLVERILHGAESVREAALQVMDRMRWELAKPEWGRMWREVKEFLLVALQAHAFHEAAMTAAYLHHYGYLEPRRLEALLVA